MRQILYETDAETAHRTNSGNRAAYVLLAVSFGAAPACGGNTRSADARGSGGSAGVTASAGSGLEVGTGGAAGTQAQGGNAGAAEASGGGPATSGGAGGNGGGVAGTTGNSGASNSGGTSGTSGASSGDGGRGGAGGRAGEGGNAGSSGSEPRAGASGAGTGGGGTTGEAGAAGEGTSAGGAGATSGRGGSGGGGVANEPVGLSWPIDCIPNQTCLGIGYPDTDEDGTAHDCGNPGYFGHQGTDINISPEAQAAGTAVRAAADGVVLFAFDGKYDQCPNANEPDCQEPPSAAPGSSTGTTVCTPYGPYCGTGEGSCYWCFAGGNVIVLRHEGIPGVFATRYDHLERNSVLVEAGDTVLRGQKIAEAASSGKSTAPHLHFEVWGTGFYELADPWAGQCGPNRGPSLWAFEPPWASD